MAKKYTIEITDGEETLEFSVKGLEKDSDVEELDNLVYLMHHVADLLYEDTHGMSEYAKQQTRH